MIQALIPIMGTLLTATDRSAIAATNASGRAIELGPADRSRQGHRLRNQTARTMTIIGSVGMESAAPPGTTISRENGKAIQTRIQATSGAR